MIGFDCVCVYVCVCVCERESERERERQRDRERERISYLILFHWFVIYLIHFSDILYNFISLICLVYLIYISMTYFYFSSLSTFFSGSHFSAWQRSTANFHRDESSVMLCYVILCCMWQYVMLCSPYTWIHWLWRRVPWAATTGQVTYGKAGPTLTMRASMDRTGQCQFRGSIRDSSRQTPSGCFQHFSV